MAQAVNHSGARAVAAAQPAFLAADVGGTHARVGLVSPRPDGTRPVTVLEYRRYACAEWPSLTAVLQDFVGQVGAGPVEHCAVASAGYVLGDAIVNDNLPWPVSIRDIRDRLGIASLAVINDFEAVAYATQFLGQADTTAVIETAAPRAEGPVLVMGPGTGLGSAVLLPGHPHATVLATEAGQIALAPGNEREIEVLRLLARERAHVSFEHALSGPGLVNLYRALCALRGERPELMRPADVTGAALARSDAAAAETLDVFCGLLGSFVGDLVLLYGARGGVFLAGGILPQIRELLLASRFAERFFNKGVMRPYLQQIPVRLMEHGQLGVIGAAGLYLDGQAMEGTDARDGRAERT
ncbi:glucokinase [Fulvimonas sp. R45]|uniref:glucokinase n=1 Tax=Fulvimonas sp. R45 TaxID=3045937 RepID=UPI00265F680A|nr:glucokinase [Fulvimonas sp. R45]MDO1529226.1 glucokinase [Fulvimonas sp. R45]